MAKTQFLLSFLEYDFTTTSWFKSIPDYMKLTRNLDGNEFVITSDGKSTGTINGFPVTITEWQKALDDGSVTLTSGSSKITVTVVKKIVKIDGKSITHYQSSASEGTSSSRPNPSGRQPSGRQSSKVPDDLDFTTTKWMTDFKIEKTITITVDQNTFVITYDGTVFYINGYPVTKNEWNQVINGKTITLTNNNRDTVDVVMKGDVIMFDGKPMTGGTKTQFQVSYGPSGTTGLEVPVTGKSN